MRESYPIGKTVPGAPWVTLTGDAVSRVGFLRGLDEVWHISDNPFDPSAWMDAPTWQVPSWRVGRSVPSRRVPSPSYVVGGLGWVSPAAGLRMETRL